MRPSDLLVLAVAVGTALAIAPRLARAEGKDLDGVVNLNTAPPEVLELLPGIGPAKVHSILWYRQRHPFRTVDELVRIKGVGRKMVRRLRTHLAISGPTTAHAVRRPISFELPPPAPPPATPARKPALAPHALVPMVVHARPASVSARDHRSRANHCARPP